MDEQVKTFLKPISLCLLIGLLLALPLHLVLGWVYLLAAPAWLPKLSEQNNAGKNPFAGTDENQPAGPPT